MLLLVSLCSQIVVAQISAMKSTINKSKPWLVIEQMQYIWMPYFCVCRRRSNTYQSLPCLAGKEVGRFHPHAHESWKWPTKSSTSLPSPKQNIPTAKWPPQLSITHTLVPMLLQQYSYDTCCNAKYQHTFSSMRSEIDNYRSVQMTVYPRVSLTHTFPQK